jgi:hypothetical protein
MANGKDLADKMEIEQALRRSHCAMKDREHECAGTMTVTPSGINLACVLCGGDDRSLGPARYMAGAVDVARRVLNRAGLEFDALSAERQADVVWAIQKGARELVKSEE